jgi:hypothetical protein
MEQSTGMELALVILLSRACTNQIKHARHSLFLSITKNTGMSIDTNELMIAILIAVLLAGTLAWVFWKQHKEIKKGVKKKAPQDDQVIQGTRQLQLQAYERLILLADRISIPNLIHRVNQPGMNAREMHSMLTQSIRVEFEHNITQQIYVTPEAWDAVRNFKEQNLLIINQVASFMPGESPGLELNKHLLDLLVQNPKASLQNVVSDALSYEAKKLMGS